MKIVTKNVVADALIDIQPLIDAMTEDVMSHMEKTLRKGELSPESIAFLLKTVDELKDDEIPYCEDCLEYVYLDHNGCCVTCGAVVKHPVESEDDEYCWDCDHATGSEWCSEHDPVDCVECDLGLDVWCHRHEPTNGECDICQIYRPIDVFGYCTHCGNLARTDTQQVGHRQFVYDVTTNSYEDEQWCRTSHSGTMLGLSASDVTVRLLSDFQSKEILSIKVSKPVVWSNQEATTTKPREACLNTAWYLVSDDRNEDYGEPQDDFKCTAELMTAYLRHSGVIGDDGRDIEPYEIAILMDLVKTSRLAVTPGKADTWIDKAGYTALGYELAVGDGKGS